MRVSKGLVLGVLGALFLGGVEALGEAAVEANVTKNPYVGSIAVPVGHVGDRVAYAQYQRLPNETQWRTPQPVWFHAYDTSRWFQVHGIGREYDMGGVRHDVVYLARAPDTLIAHAGQRLGPLGSEVLVVYNSTSVIAYDLASRDGVHGYLGGRMDSRIFGYVKADSEVGNLLPGPYPAEPDLFPPGTNLRDPALLHQGRTYTLGTDVNDWALRVIAADYAFYDFWGHVEPRNLTYQARVETFQEIDGRPAAAIQVAGCLDWQPDPVASFDLLQELFFFKHVIPARSNTCFEYREWVTADTPYPIRREISMKVDGEARGTILEVLDSYVAGTHPIPWTDPHLAPAYRNRNPDVERGSSIYHPEDGTAATIGFPLAAAKAQALTDPTLVRFMAWRAGRPDAMLIGFRLMPVGPESQGLRWDLVFGTPRGEGFVVTLEQAGRGAPATATERGEFPIASFRPDEFPTAHVTLGGAERLWRQSEGGRGASQANFVQWGYWYLPPGYRFDDTQNRSIGAERVIRLPAGLDFLIYGELRQSTATGNLRLATRTTYSLQNVVWADTVNGTVGRWMQMARDYGVAAPDLDAGPPPDNPRPLTASVPSARPDGARAAFLTSSLLLIFLATYFYPVLKFMGAKATVLVGGYAKTEKARVLEHRLRENLATIIRNEPGISPTELQAATGSQWTTLVYHLRQLEKNRLVSSLIDGRHKRYFPIDSVNWSDRDRLAALRNVRTRELYDLLLDEPGLDRHGLARRLGISRPATYFHVERLERAGLVGRDREGRKDRFFAVERPVAPRPADPKEAVEIA